MTKINQIDVNGVTYDIGGGSGDEANVVGNTLKFDQSADSKGVVANNGQPTTTDLTSLKVGDTNYAIPKGGGGGTKLYLHTLTFTITSGETSGREKLLITNTSETSLANKKFRNKDYLKSSACLLEITQDTIYVNCILEFGKVGFSPEAENYLIGIRFYFDGQLQDMKIGGDGIPSNDDVTPL